MTGLRSGAVTELRLAGAGIGVAGVFVLSELLPLGALAVLQLSDNGIGGCMSSYEALEALGRAIGASRTLEVVDLSQNSMQAPDVQALVSGGVAKGAKLCTLNLLRNALGHEGRGILLGALRRSCEAFTSVCGIPRGVTHVDLSCQHLEPEDAKLLAEELMLHPVPSINLSDSALCGSTDDRLPACSSLGLEALAASLGRQPQLEILVLRGNCIGGNKSGNSPEAFWALGRAILESASLRHVDLSKNNMCLEDAHAFLQGGGLRGALQSLDLSGAAPELLLLLHPGPLRSLDLSGAAPELLLLLHPGPLRSLDLSGAAPELLLLLHPGPLRSLDLSGAAPELLLLLHPGPLRSLDLSGAAPELLLLLHPGPLRSLDLSGAAPELLLLLHPGPLRSLDLSGNMLNGQGIFDVDFSAVVALTAALALGGPLEALNLCHTNMDGEATCQLAAAVLQHPTLR
eukprot:gene30211-37738_t